MIQPSPKLSSIFQKFTNSKSISTFHPTNCLPVFKRMCFEMKFGVKRAVYYFSSHLFWGFGYKSGFDYLLINDVGVFIMAVSSIQIFLIGCLVVRVVWCVNAFLYMFLCSWSRILSIKQQQRQQRVNLKVRVAVLKFNSINSEGVIKRSIFD